MDSQSERFGWCKRLLVTLVVYLAGAILGAALGEQFFAASDSSADVLGVAFGVILGGWFINTIGLAITAQFLSTPVLVVALVGLLGTLISIVLYLGRHVRVCLVLVFLFSALWFFPTSKVGAILMGV